MKSPRKRVKVRIGNMTYSLSADDDVQKIKDIAATADAMIEQVKRKSPGLNETSVSVLALINAVSMMQDAYEATREAYEDRDQAIEAKEEVKAELARLREQFWKMKKDLLYFRNLSDVYETKLAEMSAAVDSGYSDSKPAKLKEKSSKKRVMPLEERQTTLEAFEEDTDIANIESADEDDS